MNPNQTAYSIFTILQSIGSGKFKLVLGSIMTVNRCIPKSVYIFEILFYFLSLKCCIGCKLLRYSKTFWTFNGKIQFQSLLKSLVVLLFNFKTNSKFLNFIIVSEFGDQRMKYQRFQSIEYLLFFLFIFKVPRKTTGWCFFCHINILKYHL